METEYKQKVSFREAKLPIGKILTNKEGTCLTVETSEFKIIITDKMVNLGWLVHRPNHDHNNRTHVILNLPETGKVIEFKDRPVLHIHPDGNMPRVLRHSTFVEEIDMWLVPGKRCEWVDGGYKVLEDDDDEL